MAVARSYRVKGYANPTVRSYPSDELRWAGVRVGDASSWLDIPSFSSFYWNSGLPDSAYVCAYVGLDLVNWSVNPPQRVASCEAGISMRADEWFGRYGKQRGWYPFVNKDGVQIFRRSTPISDPEVVKLELRVTGGPYPVSGGYECDISFYVNNTLMTTFRMKSSSNGTKNCYNPKFSVDCEPYADMDNIRWSYPFDFVNCYASYIDTSGIVRYDYISYNLAEGLIHCYKATGSTPNYNPYSRLATGPSRWAISKPGGAQDNIDVCTY